MLKINMNLSDQAAANDNSGDSSASKRKETGFAEAGNKTADVVEGAEQDAALLPSELDGPLPFPMTNDYLFRVLMQRNNAALKSLICSLLHLDENDVRSVIILNPIELGRHIGEKDFFLDIKVILDNRLILNLELQVINEGNWPERSLCYLCRCFDNLKKGEDFERVLPAVQIGILNFTLFSDAPEFFATYRFMNEKSHKVYSDKLSLHVLELKNIELATEEDRAYHIDDWARLFSATTWKELKEMANKNPAMSEIPETVYTLTEDDKIRLLCEAREDYYRRTGWKDDKIQKLEEEKTQWESEKIQWGSEKAQLTSDITKMEAEIIRLRKQLEAAGASDREE